MRAAEPSKPRRSRLPRIFMRVTSARARIGVQRHAAGSPLPLSLIAPRCSVHRQADRRRADWHRGGQACRWRGRNLYPHPPEVKKAAAGASTSPNHIGDKSSRGCVIIPQVGCAIAPALPPSITGHAVARRMASSISWSRGMIVDPSDFAGWPAASSCARVRNDRVSAPKGSSIRSCRAAEASCALRRQRVAAAPTALMGYVLRQFSWWGHAKKEIKAVHPRGRHLLSAASSLAVAPHCAACSRAPCDANSPALGMA